DEEDFLFAELRYIHDHKLKRDTAGNVLFSPLTALGTYVSDTVVDAGLVEELSRDLSLAEEEAHQCQRWHPGSENITLDIFHPSNYCVVYGKTRISETPHALFGDKILDFPRDGLRSDAIDVSKSFQWLPSEFQVADDGKVTIRSYINNLHPHRHKAAYHTIAKVFGKMVPMLEAALGMLNCTSPHRIIFDSSTVPSAWEKMDKWIDDMDALPSHEERVAYIKQLPLDTPDIDWDEYDFSEQDQVQEFLYELTYDGARESIEVDIPGFPEFDSYLERTKDLLQADPVSLRGRQLQVIVKAASINLTPENPRYPGGGWHLEGTDNESIAATGILYYSVSNIKDARVEFREIFDELDLEYHQGEHGAINQVYGIYSEESINVQPCGHAEASRTGRVLVFPNSNQHRVPPFELEDPTKPGHRKMLVFFLVHPDTRVPSTLNVPPQQWEWGMERLQKIIPPRVPADCVEGILSHLGLRKDAEDKEIAKKVMEDRKVSADGRTYVYEISLCEH
ncbi:hypothetical protein HDU96_001068, partial [Phlyctochytrium bullatum]